MAPEGLPGDMAFALRPPYLRCVRGGEVLRPRLPVGGSPDGPGSGPSPPCITPPMDRLAPDWPPVGLPDDLVRTSARWHIMRTACGGEVRANLPQSGDPPFGVSAPPRRMRHLQSSPDCSRRSSAWRAALASLRWAEITHRKPLADLVAMTLRHLCRSFGGSSVPS